MYNIYRPMYYVQVPVHKLYKILIIILDMYANYNNDHMITRNFRRI